MNLTMEKTLNHEGLANKKTVEDLINHSPIFSFSYGTPMFRRFSSLASLLAQCNIEAKLMIKEEELTLVWANEGVFCSFTAWPELGIAQFVSFKDGKNFYSKKFYSIESFLEEAADVLNHVPHKLYLH